MPRPCLVPALPFSLMTEHWSGSSEPEQVVLSSPGGVDCGYRERLEFGIRKKGCSHGREKSWFSWTDRALTFIMVPRLCRVLSDCIM